MRDIIICEMSNWTAWRELREGMCFYKMIPYIEFAYSDQKRPTSLGHPQKHANHFEIANNKLLFSVYYVLRTMLSIFASILS